MGSMGVVRGRSRVIRGSFGTCSEVVRQSFGVRSKKSISKLPKNHSDASGLGARLGRLCTRFRARSCSFALTLNFSEALEALRERLVARPSGLGARLGRLCTRFRTRVAVVVDGVVATATATPTSYRNRCGAAAATAMRRRHKIGISKKTRVIHTARLGECLGTRFVLLMRLAQCLSNNSGSPFDRCVPTSPPS